MLVLIQLFLRGKGGCQGQVTDGRSIVEKNPKQTKKTKTKGRKIKKGEKQIKIHSY